MPHHAPLPGRHQPDIAVVGAGAAGLFTALIAARARARVVLISATPLAQSASYWAQGGLAAAMAQDDSPARHLEDTLAAGRGAVRLSAARVLCEEAPERVRDLQAMGLRFDADRRGHLALGLEGGHRVRRVVHGGGSATGRRVVRDLSALVALEPKIEVLEGRRVGSLWMDAGRCSGVVCDDGTTVSCPAVVLATGGAAALWRRTTNPPGSFGSGLLLALDAGAALADLELLQFHPTAVVDHRPRNGSGGTPKSVNGFLITEAIRGEGATLVDPQGNRFVDELAPRDEVARAIQDKLDETGAESVGLDMRDVDPLRFPNVVGALQESGIDPMRQLVPVAPAAHYMMGGVATDLDGRSTVPGLYAVGECACTGLHGANRLASNSLSECLVFGRRAALAALHELPVTPSVPPSPKAVAVPDRETRQAVWDNAGLIRTPERLDMLTRHDHPLAALVARSALSREESRGVHLRTDRPVADPAYDGRHGVVRAGGEPHFERWG